jgi:NAD(P) transhydrogenase subunit alpha
VQVSAAPAPAAASTPAPAKAEKRPMPDRVRYGIIAAAGAAIFLIAGFSPGPLITHFFVFALAIVIGYYVIGAVHHALHTPLLSVTNAISGIIVVGALLQIGHGDATITTLAFIAILVAGINVVGGFTVTRRMLRMFTRS